MSDTIEEQSFTEEQDDSAFEVEKDDFEEFGDFDQNDDDDFGDFDDFEQTVVTEEKEKEEEYEEEEMEPKTPTDAERFATLLDSNENTVGSFIDNYLGNMWENTIEETKETITNESDLLSTTCSRELWNKLSRDTIFYNPVTGAVGQFQWARSESNKSYLNALGVTFNNEEKSSNHHTPPINAISKKRITVNHAQQRATSKASSDGSQTHTRSISANHITASGLISTAATTTTTTTTNTTTTTTDSNSYSEEERAAKKEKEQELELDLDIARAYCELTEETIRIYPDVKLNAMVTDLTRLQRQAGEYLENLLDQREQLLMDAETYNDLISCIVGHAQRLREQNANKDASPAMVSKSKKKNGGLSNIMKRKTAAAPIQSASMGGGVVGVKQGPMPKKTVSSASLMTAPEGRRSL